MNIHPLFVHFPIGLLVVYSILEICAYFSPSLRRQTWVSPVKVFLLFMGALSALLALATGGIAGDLIEGVNPRAFILEVHEPFAVTTTILYLVLSAAYLVRIFDTKGWGSRIASTNKFLASVWNFKKHFCSLVLDTWLLPLLALLAFTGLFVTGALGAAVVYGPDTDPFVSFVYHLFWVQ